MIRKLGEVRPRWFPRYARGHTRTPQHCTIKTPCADIFVQHEILNTFPGNAQTIQDILLSFIAQAFRHGLERHKHIISDNDSSTVAYIV